MRKLVYLFAGLMTVSQYVVAENISLSTPNTTLVLSAEKGKNLKYIYYGEALTSADIESIGYAGMYNHDAYPVYGMVGAGETALAVKHSDGNMSRDMYITDVRKEKHDGKETVVIDMK